MIYLNAIHLWIQRKKYFSSGKRLNRVFVTAVIEIIPWICLFGCRPIGCWRSHIERFFRFPFCNLRVAAGRYVNTLED
jgi:hypothetical protein